MAMVLLGCPKQAPEPAGPPVIVNPVEVELQVAAVTPLRAFEGQPVQISVMGEGFRDGARVVVGPTEASSVLLVSSQQLRVSLPPMALGVHDVVVTNPDGTQTTLVAGLSVEERTDLRHCGYIVVYFDLDRSQLTSDAEELLTQLADCLGTAKGRIDVDGHADARGTTDYNIQLSDQRARAVLAHLTTLGVSSDRIATTAWGEERPAEPGWNERAWALNRRVELTLAE